MSFLKYYLPAAIAASCLCYAQDSQFEGGYATETAAKERDFDALQEYIKTKRAITVKEKGGNMMISGDIRGEYYRMHAVTDHKIQRGWDSRYRWPNSKFFRAQHKAKEAMKDAKEQLKHAGEASGKAALEAALKAADPALTGQAKREADLKAQQAAARVKDDKKADKKKAKAAYKAAKVAYREAWDKMSAPMATNEFDVQVNLTFDYIAERAWGTIRLQMEDPLGIPEYERKLYMNDNRNIMYGSGKLNEIVLRKAFAGYNFYEQGEARFDMEIGRRRFYEAFDSRIQFGSWFDGILARYTDVFEGYCDFSAKAAAFIVDYTVNHYGYVGELGFLNLVDSGVDFKYSIIDWDLKRPNRFGRHHAYGTRFVNSQFLVAYNLPPDLVGMKSQLYAAYLINHDAPRTHFTHHRKANQAGYIGGQIGEAIHQGDWAAEIYYMWVQAQAVSEREVSAASRDNPRKISFYDARWGGGANFRGYRAELFYALTDNWTFNAHFDKIREMCHRIGGKHRSNELYFGLIFAF